MPSNALYYDLTPQIVRADRETAVVVRPLFEHVALKNDAAYEVTYYPCEEFALRSGWPEKNKITLRAENGVLVAPWYFEGEQEHVLRVEEIQGERRKPVRDFRVYSLHDDLYNRYPYKGDMHMHSFRSDGQESPGYVAGACRRIGLDFMALTDHGQYSPSLESQKAFEGVDLDLRIYPGEEVHPPQNPVHMINFGGGFSVNDLFRDKESYYAAVRAIEERLPALPPGASPYQYASCVFCFEKIREGGGLGIFCHPYWFTDNRYYMSGALTSAIFEHRPFDAYELIGGYHRFEAESNTLQVARYHEERSQGREMPIVGVSDAHGCDRGELFGWYYSIVFSPSTDLPDLADSVKGLYSVAVEAMPGEMPRAYGPFRLVKYTLFLMRELFPRHDDLCYEEGRWMLRHLAGDPFAADMLARLQGRTQAWLKERWGR